MRVLWNCTIEGFEATAASLAFQFPPTGLKVPTPFVNEAVPAPAASTSGNSDPAKNAERLQRVAKIIWERTADRDLSEKRTV